MNIQEKISEVQCYFKSKIAKNEFTISRYEENWMILEIDGYKFALWTPKEDHFGFLDVAGSLMDLEITEVDKKTLWPVIMEARMKHFETVEREKKLKQLEILKKELGL